MQQRRTQRLIRCLLVATAVCSMAAALPITSVTEDIASVDTVAVNEQQHAVDDVVVADYETDYGTEYAEEDEEDDGAADYDSGLASYGSAGEPLVEYEEYDEHSVGDDVDVDYVPSLEDGNDDSDTYETVEIAHEESIDAEDRCDNDSDAESYMPTDVTESATEDTDSDIDAQDSVDEEADISSDEEHSVGAYVSIEQSSEAQVAALSKLALTGYRGKIYYGFSGNQMSNADYMAQLGRVPALKNEFFSINNRGFSNPGLVDTFVDQTVADMPNAMIMLTLEPFDGLDELTAGTYSAIAARCLGYNQRGIKLFIRFAHEMNADWYIWGAKPQLYKSAFRALTMAIRQAARQAGSKSLTQMVWAPTVAYKDQNAPYTDFYPGDDVVDWVGLSVYYYVGKPPAPDVFEQALTNGAGQNFYKLFCQQRGKPLMIAETSAPTLDTVSVQQELAVKRPWWTQIYSRKTAMRFPMMRMVVWFEFNKKDRKYGVFSSDTIRRAFVSDVVNVKDRDNDPLVYAD